MKECKDEDGFEFTLKAMKGIGWGEHKIDEVMSLVAGILHLGQIRFNGVEDEGGQEMSNILDEGFLEKAANLLGLNAMQLKAALTQHTLITRGVEIKINLDTNKSYDSRDAIAKTIYGGLFTWIVQEVNKCVIWEDNYEENDLLSTGVLDIFGFESFAVNSFEQLCINFANEKLQQHFNNFIFKVL